jgi:6-phosphogluconolactonase (cycloisomerase 2 family)
VKGEPDFLGVAEETQNFASRRNRMNSPRRGSLTASVARFTRATIATRIVIAVLAVTILALVPVAVQAQSYVYVNNQAATNTISAYSVSSSGSLTEIAGSPFATGGAGATSGCYGIDRMVVNAATNLLFVSNAGNQTISVMQTNAATGALTAAPGSPFAAGLTLDACSGISLAVTPDGKFLMASSNGTIKTFNVAASGILTPAASTPNCCSPTVGMRISPDGHLLAVSNESSVSVYTVNADGSLTATGGSPFPRTGTGLLSSVEFSCSANLLYGSEASAGTLDIIDAWSVSSLGSLAAIAGNPFTAAGADSSTMVLSADNSLLFTNNQFNNKINSFSINPDGSLKSIGGFGGVGTVHAPAGMAPDASGSFLYVADDTFGVAVYKITPTGGLASVSDTAIKAVGTVQGIAAYPPKSCTSADLALTIAADSPSVAAGANVSYTITITNNGPNASSATIVDNLPTGESFVSCTSTGAGICSNLLTNPHTITFASLASGQSETVTLVAATSSSLLNGATLTNTVTLGPKSASDPNPANNSATVTSNVTATASATSLTVSPATGNYGGLATLTGVLRKLPSGPGLAGKPVTFTLNGTPVGTVLTDNIGQAILTTSVAGIPLGTYPAAVSASFAGDSLFTASSGAGSLTVNKAVLSVIGSSAVRLYGDANPGFTYVITGFLNGDTAAVVSGTTTCDTSTPTGVTTSIGHYPVVCGLGTLSSANYTFVAVPGTLSVNPAPLTVSADNETRVYGDPNPVFTGTVTGLRNGDVLTPTYSTIGSIFAQVGTYPIVPFIAPSPLSANYAITYINGTLTITSAPLTLNVNNASRAYGDPDPVFTGTLVGIKNNDVITASYSTTATATSPIGTYPITATLSGLNLPNYTVTINPGTLTITQAALTVTAADASRLYGNANPVFTGTIVGIRNGDPITATFSSVATPASVVGTYPIVPALVDPLGKVSNYTVTLVNGTLTITPAPLSVAAGNTNRNYGNANPTFTGTITGLKNADPITANFTTTATITSPVGTYPITFASFNDPAGKLSNYIVTSTTNGILTIRPAPLTVAGFNGTRFYGDPNPAPAITGIKNGDPITAGYDATAPGPTAAAGGTFTLVPLVNASPALSNYTVTIQNGRITVNKAPLSVVANNLSRPYGSVNSTLTGTITGVKNGENITASFSTTATQTSNVGTFAITAAAVFNPTTLSANYTLTTTNGVLTVTTVPLTIAANNQTIILGAAVAPSATYTGFVLGQTPANLAGTLSCSAAAGTGNVGSSAINCSGQSSTNYAITFTPGTATVTYQVATVACTNGASHQILAPISGAGTTVFTKATTPTIPVQFRVCDSKGTSVSSSGVVSSFVLTAVNSTPASTPAPQGGPFAFVGGALANGAGNAGWQFNLSTSNLSAGNTYAYRINLNDGTNITFQFRLQ